MSSRKTSTTTSTQSSNTKSPVKSGTSSSSLERSTTTKSLSTEITNSSKQSLSTTFALTKALPISEESHLPTSTSKALTSSDKSSTTTPTSKATTSSEKSFTSTSTSSEPLTSSGKSSTTTVASKTPTSSEKSSTPTSVLTESPTSSYKSSTKSSTSTKSPTSSDKSFTTTPTSIKVYPSSKNSSPETPTSTRGTISSEKSSTKTSTSTKPPTSSDKSSTTTPTSEDTTNSVKPFTTGSISTKAQISSETPSSTTPTTPKALPSSEMSSSTSTSSTTSSTLTSETAPQSSNNAGSEPTKTSKATSKSDSAITHSTFSAREKSTNSKEPMKNSEAMTTTTTPPTKATTSIKSKSTVSHSTTSKTEEAKLSTKSEASSSAAVSEKPVKSSKTRKTSPKPEKIESTTATTVSKKSTAKSKTVKKSETSKTTTSASKRPTGTSNTVKKTEKISITSKSTKKPTTSSKSTSSSTKSQKTPKQKSTINSKTSQKTRSPSSTTQKFAPSTTASSQKPIIKTGTASRTTTTDMKTTNKKVRTTGTSSTGGESTTSQLDTATLTTIACPEEAFEGPEFCYRLVPDGNRNKSYIRVKSACNAIFGEQSSIINLYEFFNMATLNIFKNLTAEKKTTVFWIDNGGSKLQRSGKLVQVYSSFAPNFFRGVGIETVPLGTIDPTVGGICKTPKYAKRLQCTSNTFYEVFDLRGKMNLPPAGLIFAAGYRMQLECALPNTYYPKWDFLCTPRGLWKPHPDYVNCSQRRGTPFEDSPRGPLYGKEQSSCNNCLMEGTESCNSTESGKFVCICKPGWMGFRCQRTPLYCGDDKQAAQLCRMGRCVNERNGYKCICKYGVGGSHCTLNRTVFEWNSEGWLSSTQAASMTSVVSLVSWFFCFNYVAQSDRNFNSLDRQATVQLLRGWATLTMQTIFAFFRHPAMFDTSTSCGIMYFIFTWMHVTVCLLFAVESISYGSLLMNKHRNGFHSWDGLHTSALTYMAASSWSCVGWNVDTIDANLYLIPIILLPAFGFKKFAESLSTVRVQFRERLRAWFAVYSPRNIDFYSRVLRNGPLLDIMPFASALQYWAMVRNAAEPEDDFYRTFAALAITVNILLHWLQFLVTAPPFWSWTCNRLMIHLPAHLAPKFNTVLRWTREEVLCWLAPKKFAREFEEKLELENKRRKTQIEEAIRKREKMLEMCPSMNKRYLPAVPVFLAAEAPSEQLTKLTPNGIERPEDYLSDHTLEIIQTRFFVRYIRERLNSRCEKMHCAFVSLMEDLLGLNRVFKRIVADEWTSVYYEQHTVARHQLIRLFKECCDTVRENDNLLFEGEKPGMDPLKMNPPLAKCFEITKRWKRRKEAPPANSKEAEEKYEKLLESIGFRYPVGDFTSFYYADAVEQYDTSTDTKWITRAGYIRTMKELEERLQQFEEQSLEENAIWDHVYDNDEWFMERTDEEKAALKAHYNILDSSLHANPRKAPIRLNPDRNYDQMKPGFIGPVTPNGKKYPDFKGLFSTARLFFEEEDDRVFDSFHEVRDWKKSDEELYELNRAADRNPKKVKKHKPRGRKAPPLHATKMTIFLLQKRNGLRTLHKPQLKDVGEGTGPRKRFKTYLRQ
ncbi:unnamed protein product [Caenorhabditis auriculariae]|uniref:EGF-like domain-containing protein n=1 Tax=Caenorhabditis auriculariae TaxID=2777116 RepID=A0A8S1HI99_9PELO|nr:unnamed protein product [Caenorhabditis auriculariae]